MTARNSTVDVILSRIDCGKLPPDQTKAMLHEIINEEISRTDASADTGLIDGCLELLEQLHQPVDMLPERKKSRILLTAGKWAAAAAILVLLALGYMDKLHLAWLEHDNTSNGQQHIIIGHEIRVDMIEKAIADHSVHSSYSLISVQEMEKELGFNPGVLPALANDCKLEDMIVFFRPSAIYITARYHTAVGQQDYITLSIQCFTDMSETYRTFEQSKVGTLQRINGVDVYLSHNAETDEASWLCDSTVFSLSANKNSANVLLHVQHLLEHFILPDNASASVTPEQIEACIQCNLANPEQLETSDFSEVCDFLGFAPAIFNAETIGAECVDFIISTSPIHVIVDSFYRDAEGSILAYFTNLYSSDTDEMHYTYEQNEEGHSIWINGQQVYASSNFDMNSYCWTQGTTASIVQSPLDEGVVRDALSEFFAGNVMTREAQQKPIADITSERIEACIQRNLANPKPLSTSDFSEVCDLLGFVPPMPRPEVLGDVEPLFTVLFFSSKIQFSVLYSATDSTNNVTFVANFYRSMADVYDIFEQSEVGVFQNVSGVNVYYAPNLSRTTYSWSKGQVTYYISGVLPVEATLPLLEAFFAGDVHTP